MQKITPGFLLQLRLLLWKNFTIKRRSPVVFLVEVSLPLVLILILLLIRQSQHAYQIPISHYTSKPLPSAGIIPILQLFCDGQEDVYEQKNLRLEDILSQVQTIVVGLDKLQNIGVVPHLGDMSNIVQQNNISKLMQKNNIGNIKASSIIEDKDQFTEILKSYDVDDVVISSLLQSTINSSQVFETLGPLVNKDNPPEDISSIVVETLLIVLFSNDPVSDIVKIIKSREVLDGICSTGGISDLFMTANSEDKQQFVKFKEAVCTMDTSTLLQLVKDISSIVDTDSDITQTVFNIRDIVKSWIQSINDQIQYQRTELSSCQPFHHTELTKNISKTTDNTDKYVGLIRFWKLLEPTVCRKKPDKPLKSSEVKRNDTNMRKNEEMELSSQQKKYLSLVKNILYKSPKILFAPNNTVIQQLIEKANESFAFYDGISRYAKWWMNISDDMRNNILKSTESIKRPIMDNMSHDHGLLINTTFDVLDELACIWLGFLKDINLDVFKGFGSERELEKYFLTRQYQDNVTVIAGVVFEDMDTNTKSLPAHVRYKIRQNATLTPTTKLARSPIWFPSPGSNNIKYYDFGFVWIQDIIEHTIIDLQVGRIVSESGNYVKRIPYPCWPWDGFVWNIQHIFPLCLMLSWVYTVSTLVQRIVYEKEKRLKEVMKMMGLSGTVHWCAWFITAFVQMTILVSTITLMLYYGRVLPYSNPVLVFVFLEVFAVSSIAFSFLISSFFSKSRLAAACAGIFYFLSYVPYAYISIREDISNTQIPSVAKLAASIFSTSAFGLGGKYFLYYEIEGVGVTWQNFGRSPRENDDFSLLKILLMMIIDTVLYGILTWYIQNIHPGTYGLPKPWYFPVTKSYWLGGGSEFKLKELFTRKYRNKYSELSQVDDDPLTLNLGNNEYFEKDSTDNPVCVEICNLTKVYSGGKGPAVDDLNLTLKENQTTAFLGHNGAGKTTTMSILTGLFPPTSGTAKIYGHDICTEMSEVRKNLGMCPQHNVLFESLTVAEHLWFYARLKGMQAEDIKKETDRMLNDLGLSNKKMTMPDCLSGGMQRKLSVAIAFVGGAKTVILDEPTAGVDPYSRRSIWKLLGQYKKGRTILLSTHHMDEADKLGDRIAIMSNGSLRCCGSSLYLRTLLGDGQHIHILKQQLDPRLNTVEDLSKTDDILENIQRYVPSSFLKFESQEELAVTVPVGATEKNKMAEICESLFNSRQELKIKSFGVNDSGLEEIFVKITQQTKMDETDNSDDRITENNKTTKSEVQIDDLHLYPLNDNEYEEKQRVMKDNIFKSVSLTRRRNPFQHFQALFLKRIYYTLRNRKGVISQIILPAVFVSISMTIALSAPKDSDPPKMILSTGQYTKLMKPNGNFVPILVKNPGEYIGQDASTHQIINSIMSSGLGADCTVNTSGFSVHKEMLQMKESFYGSECKDELSWQFNINTFGQAFSIGVLKVFGCLRYPMFAPEKYFKLLEMSRTGSYIKGMPYYPICQCKRYSQFVCSKARVFDPPDFQTVVGDHIQNISGLKEEDFYLYTTQKYRLHRYGGLSVGHNLSYVPKGFGHHSAVFKNFLRKLIAKTNTKIRFDQNGYHSMPTYINAFNNAILRANLPKIKGNPSSYGITLINHPMKKTSNLLDTDYINGGTDVLMGIFIIVAMSFVPASFVVFLVHERAIRAKHLQFISGVQPITYWLSNLIWDMVNYIIPATCIICILLAFRIPAYVGKGNIEAVTALFLVYGWSITPMMYPATFIFRESSIAYISLIIVNLFTGITCVVTSFMLQIFNMDKNLSSINHYLKTIFLVFPNFCLGDGLMEIALNQYENDFYFHIDQLDKIQSPLVWHLTGRKLVAMTITGVVFFIFTILCEYRFFFTYRKPILHMSSNDEELDLDVLREKEKVHLGPRRDDLLRLVDLTKIYKTRKRGKIRAVNGLNLAIRQGECFGLLGINGAGKTTTFKMLTGDIMPTSGDTTLLNHSFLKNRSVMQQHIGYCPQMDALFDELTPREHLQLYARLHGITAAEQENVVNWVIDKLGLRQYCNQTSATLSGGNRRKLSTAISLVGNPTLIYMDEPTAGMDPYSKKFLWKTIHELVQDGKSVIFTSHSMEECEILCSRLSIMVNGQLKCLGNVQHLKDKFGEGYTLKIQLESGDKLRKVLMDLKSVFTRCILKERGPKMVVFEVESEWSKLSESYRGLERLVHDNYITEYSLSRNTLDNVFINFARQQNQSSKDIEVDVNEYIETSGNTLICEPGTSFDEPLTELAPRGGDRYEHSDEELLPL